MVRGWSIGRALLMVGWFVLVGNIYTKGEVSLQGTTIDG